MINQEIAPAKVLKSIRMLNENTIEIEFMDHVLVDNHGVREVYKILDEMTQDLRIKKLLIIGKGTEITKEARHMIVEENKIRKSQIIAEAIVVHSFAQKLVANFYISLLQNIYPTHFFVHREKAEEWLQKSDTQIQN